MKSIDGSDVFNNFFYSCGGPFTTLSMPKLETINGTSGLPSVAYVSGSGTHGFEVIDLHSLKTVTQNNSSSSSIAVGRLRSIRIYYWWN